MFWRSFHLIEIGGLPAHVLLVHAVVVLGPIAGLGAIIYALVRRWWGHLAWPLGVLSLGLVPVTLLTAQAGEQLEKARPASTLVHEHAEQGDVLKVVSVTFFVLVAAMLMVTYEPFGRRLAFLGGLRGNRIVRGVLLAAGAVVGAVFIYQSVITGHSGAASVWAR
jgi:phosphatidylserine synthase